MTIATDWQAPGPGPCPACGGLVVLADDGTGTARVDCAACEYTDTWTVTDPAWSPR